MRTSASAIFFLAYFLAEEFPLKDTQGIDSISDVEVDHIWPQSFGGPDHPYNYYLIPKQGRLNWYFYKFLNAEKLAFIGEANACKVQQFLTWLRGRCNAEVFLSDFTAVWDSKTGSE